MSVRAAPLVLGLLALLAAPALGETVRLRSGDVLEGKVADHGDRLLVATDHGDVSVRWRDVDVVLRDRTARDVYADRRQDVDAKDAGDLYALALWAQRAGLHDEARRCAESVVALEPDHEGARSLLGQQKADGSWLSGDELLAAKGFVSRDGRWVLREEAEAADRKARPVKRMSDDEQRVADLLHRAAEGPERARKFALEALAGMSPDDLARPALRALRRGTPAERRLAASLLARWGDVDAVRPLIHTAIKDREKSVRGAAVEALKEIDHEDTLRPFARALWSDTPIIRTHAAEALGSFGGAASVEWIIRRLKTGGGPGGRNHIFVGRQLSYISDFDVEIAQASQIGDPIVGTIREGVILDTRVLGVQEEFTTVERRVYYHSLRQAAGRDIGDDVALWEDWYEREGRAELAGS
jgi:HEAT repeat protein